MEKQRPQTVHIFTFKARFVKLSGPNMWNFTFCRSKDAWLHI